MINVIVKYFFFEREKGRNHVVKKGVWLVKNSDYCNFWGLAYTCRAFGHRHLTAEWHVREIRSLLLLILLLPFLLGFQ